VNVRDAALDVMRSLGMRTVFGNPGSTEVSFLTDLPDDLDYVLALHEGSVVGIASGYALGRGKPAFVNLHTAPGLGNATAALANARDCRAPLVVVVGQQDRRHLAHAPFLAGRGLERLAGDYPVWSTLPVRAQDVPGAIARGYHEAMTGRGPAIVVVPMDDWLADADPLAAAAPTDVLRPCRVTPEDVRPVAQLLAGSSAPAIVVGAGADSSAAWEAIVTLAEALRCPVWQEPFGSRAGFPQDHPLFAGHLPWRRRALRERLAGHDFVLAIGTHAFRTYLFDDPVELVAPGTRVAVVSDDPAEIHRSACQVALLAAIAPACAALADQLPAREVARLERLRAPDPPDPLPPAPGEPLLPAHVLSALAERLPPDAVLVEETPSSRPELLERIPARAPLGFVSTANGGLGFGLAGAIGLRMALPERPVVGVIGDGAAMYAIQALWSAAHYRVGVLLIVMNNGGYAIMDAQARERGGAAPWPGFDGTDVAGIARCMGCASVRVTGHPELIHTLDEVMPGLAQRREPLLVEIALGNGVSTG
jgi:benzoylformate decarboxylase